MATKKLTRKCPICGYEQGEVLHKQKFSLPKQYELPDCYDVVSCDSCGFAFADTSASQDMYDRFYRFCSKYEDERVSTGSGAQAWDAERLEGTTDTLAAQLPNEDAAILDIGCASGGLLVSLRKRGYRNVVGVDPSQVCVEQVRAQGIEAHLGGVFERSREMEVDQGRLFDLVILSHVMEHIRDVDQAIKNISDLLAPNGLLYIETPNVARYREHFKVPFYYFDCEHINHFDLSSLRNLSAAHRLAFLTGAEKKVRIDDDSYYPVVYAFIKKTGKPASVSLTPDFSTRDSLNRYIEMSNEWSVWPELETFELSQEPIIIWGAGSYTQRLLSNTALGLCNIIAFIDNDKNKQGTKLRNIEIQPPAYILSSDAPIIVCAALHSHAIISEIERMNVINRIIVLEGSKAS